MEKFIEFMQSEIPKVFESKEYEEQKTRIVDEAEKAKEVLFAEAGQARPRTRVSAHDHAHRHRQGPDVEGQAA